MNISSKKILIVGLGLIGGSYAKRLKKNGHYVGAITLNHKDIDYAIENNIIDEGTVEVKKEFVSQFDIVIFALYPSVFIKWIEQYYSYFKKNAIISDVSGVKTEVVYKVQEILKDQSVEFIGAHPMAGREVYGVINSSDTLFEGANFIITPTPANTQKAIDIVSELANELGFKTISILTPSKHDEMIAFLSQLTHCIAVSLMTCKESQHLKDYTGDSFRDLTRIANINENMWSELFLMNKKELLSQMDLFIEEFNKLRDSLENEDVETMKDMMRLSTYRRSFFNKK